MNLLWISGGLGLALIIVSGFAIGEAQSIGGLKEQREANLAVIAKRDVDLKAKTEEAQELRTAHEACVAEIAVSKNEQSLAHGRIVDLEKLAQGERNHVRIEREAFYKLPGCKELVALDLVAACPDLAGSLRRRSAEVSAPRESAGAGAGAARPVPDR